MTEQSSMGEFFWPISLPVRILFIDDNPLFQQVVTMKLEKAKYLKVVRAANFTEDLNMLIEVLRPQVVLMDLGKLDLTRMGIIKAAKKKITNIIVITMADQDSPVARQSARLAGSDEFMVKGEAITKLIPTLQRLLLEKEIKPS